MRKVESRRRFGAGLAGALALGACHPPDEISLGGATTASGSATTFYLSPSGNDDDAGTSTHPWRTFAKAFKRLGPATTLVLLDGTYDGGTTGYLDARCSGAGATASNGAAGAPITVRADHPRAAFLRGDASGPPFFVDGCSYWTFQDLRVESDDLANAPDTVDAGSVVVLGANHDIRLTGLLARHPNRYKHSHVVRIGDGSHDIVVEGCELYDFHHNAFETWRTSNLEFRRNYVHSRDTPDLTGGYVSDDQTRGDYGFLLEETRNVALENNVIEDVNIGIGVVGRYMGLSATDPPPVPADDPLDGNQLLGNVVLAPSSAGIRLDSRCQKESPCTEPARSVRNTTLIDDVVVGAAAGLDSAGAIGTNVQNMSVLASANGLLFVTEDQNVGVASTSMTANTLAVSQAEAFRVDGETNWSFDHCAASSSNGAVSDYVPDDGHVTNKVVAPPASDLGGCLVYLPATSVLKGAGSNGHDVGANVLFRYELGVLTTMPLWIASGANHVFPCGAVVPGVNDDADTSCGGVHKRLHVGAADCPYP
ncbi:MAG TPA: right-handed parallel beta-helix repeat-containing protein [Polyangia bacterium]|nr:right-handed parallel beta-helix repeat-containing protein [Polyangia bacterium]